MRPSGDPQFDMPAISGFGGLEVSMLASGTQDHGSDFSDEKNPQHAFLQRESKVARPMSQICGM
jgi:hypothetical protein